VADLPVKDFTGGLTDFPIGSDSTVFEAAENFTINEYSDLITRPGTRYDFSTGSARARVDNHKRIGLLMPQTTGTGGTFTVLKQAQSKLYYDNATAQAELLGPDSAEAFPGVAVTDAFSYANWNNHTIITHEGSPWQIPTMVYRDGSGNLQLRTAGLPQGNFSATTATGGSGQTYIYGFVYNFTYTVGTTEYIIRSRPYLKEFTNIGTGTPSSSPAISLDGLADLNNASGEHYGEAAIDIEIYRTIANGSTLYYVGAVDNNAVNNPAGGTAAYSDTTSDNTLLVAGRPTLYTTGNVLANDRPPKCKYVHGTSDFVYYANGFEVTTASADGEYIPNRIWQSKIGNPSHVPAGNYADIEEPITGISSVKSVPIVFGENSVYRLDGFFTDTGNGNISPKKISDGVGCVGHGSIVQTLNGLFFAGNDGFYFTDGYKITPISSNKFKATYKRLISSDLNKKRIQGVFDSDEQLVIWACLDSAKYPNDENNVLYVMDLETYGFTTWASGYNQNGPYNSGSLNVNGTTLTMGSTDGVSRGDFVSVSGDKTVYVISVDSDTTLTLSKSFANASYSCEFFNNKAVGLEYFENCQPSSLLFADNTLWQGDGRGFCLYYDQDEVNDVLVDETLNGTTGSTAIAFKKLGILHRYAGAILDLGTTSYRKWVNSVIIKMRPRADVTTVTAVTPFGENDDNDSKQEMGEIYSAGFYPWGTPLLSYGDPRLYRRRQQIVDAKRRFPANSLRCEYKQLHLENAFVAVINSDVYGLVTITAGSNSVTKTVTLTASTTWPDNLFNYWISFIGDGYVKNYKILSRNSASEVTILDPDGDVAAAVGVKWVVRAYPDNNFINLVEYSFLYEVLGSSQSQFISTSGNNV
jgi:hypothetical protein